MGNEYREPTSQEERDNWLVTQSVVTAAVVYYDGYDGWLVEECKEAIMEAEVCSLLYADDTDISHRLAQALERMRHLQQHDIPEGLKVLKDKIDDVNMGYYTHVVEARHHIEETIVRLDGYVNDLLDYRTFLKNLDRPG